MPVVVVVVVAASQLSLVSSISNNIQYNHPSPQFK